MVISPQKPYSPYDNPSVPLKLSPQPYQILPRQLFPPMALEGEFPSSSQGPPKVSSTHTPSVNNDFEYDFPPEGYPYVGSVAPPPPPESSGPIFPPGYTSLAQMVSGTSSVSSLYQNSIWSSSTMPTSGLFISNVASQIPIPTTVLSLPVQPTVTVGETNVPISSQGAPLSGQYVPPPIPSYGGKQTPPPYVPPVSGGPYVSAPQTHAIRASQNVSSVPYPSGSSIPSGSGQISYQ